MYLGWKSSLGAPTLPICLGPQFFYHNFDRSNYDDDDIRNCAVLDLASLQWMPMQCEAQLDWICKLPKGTMEHFYPQQHPRGIADKVMASLFLLQELM